MCLIPCRRPQEKTFLHVNFVLTGKMRHEFFLVGKIISFINMNQFRKKQTFFFKVDINIINR